VIPALNAIYLYFTDQCNQQCRHCWIKSEPVGGHKYPSKDIDLDVIMKALNQAIPLGLKKVKLTGGEPFFRKDIVSLLKWCKKKEIRVDIESNGTLVGPPEAKAMRDAGVAFISVSLDGPNAAVYNKLRDGQDAFGKALNGIRSIKKYHPLVHTQIIFSLWEGNREYLDEMIAFARKEGVMSLKINPVLNIFQRAGKMHARNELLTVREILKIYKRTDSVSLRKGRTRILFDIPVAFKPLSRITEGCCACGIKNMLGVLSDGSVSICGIGRKVPSVVMGHIRTDKLRDIWHESSLLKDVRENIPSKLEGVCGTCFLKHICLGRCRAQSLYATGSLYGPYMFCALAEKEKLFPRNLCVQRKGEEHERAW
jgi:SynChlorMet cassette radical SAM/SPASM protein ScmF